MPIRIRFEYSLYRWWGVPSRYNQLIDHLDQKRFRATLHGASDVPDEDDLPSWLSSLRPWLNCWGRHGGIPWYRLSNLSAEVQALQSCNAGNTDIVHFMDANFSAQFLPRHIRTFGPFPIRTVASFHQPLDVTCRNFGGNELRWLDAIILMSHSQLPFYRRYVPEERIHVFLHGVDTNFYRPAKQQKLSPRLTCIMTGHNYRDWRAFRNVAAAMPEVTFVVVTSPRIKLDGPNIVVHTGISDAELAKLYRSADVLFLPLTDATANNALLEGIASGLPVVTTDLEGVRAYLPGKEALLVLNNRTEAFVAALRRLQQNVDLRQEMGRHARARAEELAWPRVVRQYEDLYTRVLEQAPVRAAAIFQVKLPNESLPSYRLPGANLNADVIETAGRVGSLRRLASGPDSFENLHGWGHVLFDAGLSEEASVLFASMAAAFPPSYRVHAGLALSAEARWNWRRAIEQWDNCIVSASPNGRIEATARKAKCCVQIGQLDRARDLYGTIADSFEGMEGLARLSVVTDTPDVASQQLEALTLRFPDRLEGFLQRGRLLVERAAYEQAESLLTHVVRIWPESLAAASLWATCAERNKHWEQAAARWAAVVERDPGVDCAAYAQYLVASSDQQQLAAHEARLNGHPRIEAEFFLEYYLALGELAEAAVYARKLVDLERRNLSNRVRYADVLMRCGFPEALSLARMILEELRVVSPDAVGIQGRLVEAFIRSGMDREAIDLLKTVPKEDNSIFINILRVWARHQAGHDTVANEFWRGLFLMFELIQKSKKLDDRLIRTELSLRAQD